MTPKQIAEGMNAASRNAARLLADAELLLQNGRFPTATSIAVLSIEESGKVSILRHLACIAAAEAAKNIWSEYRSHTKKNVAWLLPQLLQEGARKLNDFASLFDDSSDHPVVLDQVKQIGFYTDCLGQAHWSEPVNVIDEQLAKGIVAIAKILCAGKPVTEAEIALWVQHVGPHIHGTKAAAEAALQKWYEQMQFLGLAPSGENAMEQFILHGVA
jgi:AbiV family abortive infection protein